MMNTFKKIIAVASAIIAPLAMMPVCTQAATANANITIDGDASDWGGVDGQTVTELASNQMGVETVKFAFSEDGKNLLVCYSGISRNIWSQEFLADTYLVVNGTTLSNPMSQFQYMGYAGCEVKFTNTASGSNNGDYIVEASIPVSLISSSDFTIALYDKETVATSAALSSADVPVIDGKDYVAEEEEAVYSGIKIDGKFSDWNAVNKTEATDANNCISAVASVFDGDYLYIYIKDADGCTASGAGEHDNGMFCITSDLNRTMVFQLNADGTVSGKDGITSTHHADQWEIAIPKSALPRYRESVSFGLYLADPILTGITNLQDDEGTEGNVGTFDGIVYDGLFGDWAAYPHTLIQYGTSGSSEVLADGESAIYSNDGILYGHVESAMHAHTSEYGLEMTSNIHIRFNGEDETSFSPRLVEVDENGNINWSPDFTSMEDCSSHEYYLADISAWGVSKNLSDLNENDTMYGKIIITVGGEGQIDECEYYLELDKIADKLGMDADDFKLIEAQFGQIGEQWTSYSGTSSGPWAGVAICIGSVGIPMLIIKKRKKKAVKPALES